MLAPHIPTRKERRIPPHSLKAWRFPAPKFYEYRVKRDGDVVATVAKRWIAMTEAYGVETAPGEDDVLILASVLALDLAEDRERRG